MAALERSLNELIRRHESWRTSFPLLEGQPVQVIQPPFALPLPRLDLRHLPPLEREAEALHNVADSAHRKAEQLHNKLMETRQATRDRNNRKGKKH